MLYVLKNTASGLNFFDFLSLDFIGFLIRGVIQLEGISREGYRICFPEPRERDR